MRELPDSVEVVVVGFGPVGATIANLLGQYGVRTLVVDRATDILMMPRAIALDNEALRILQLAGLGAGAFDTVAIPFVRMRSPYIGEFAQLNTAGVLDGHPKLVTFYQPDLEAVLRRRVREYPHVITRLGMELVDFLDEGASVRIDLRDSDGNLATTHARYMIGADGASSAVRRRIGMEFDGHTYAEDWLIVDARNVEKTIDHVEFLCDPRRPTPHMVAPGNRVRWEFMLHPGERREEMERIERIRALLAPWGRPEEMEVERHAVYRFHARTVDCFQKGNVFLAGDAAHLTPPFIGQGLCAGLRDAANLCWKLAWVLRGCAGAAILGSYDVERRPHAKAMIDLARMMGRLVMPRNVMTAILLHGLVWLLRQIRFGRALLDELKIKPRNRFRAGLFVANHVGRLESGDMFPQAWLRRDGREIKLSDDLFGVRLILVGFGRDPEEFLDPDSLGAWRNAGGHCVQLCHAGQQLHRNNREAWEDFTGRIVPETAPVGSAAIVRPDRTVLHVGAVSESSRLVREALALIGAPGTLSDQTPSNSQIRISA
jgi:3-(3-hydroxy-phenyl)propionate hydroxylase